MSITTYNAYALAGGTSDSVDSYPASALNHGDRCFCMDSGVLYYYVYDAAATDPESSPDIIRPDTYSEAGVWKLVQSPLAEQHLIDRGNAETSLELDCGSYDTHTFTCNVATLTLTFSGLAIGQTIVLVISGADTCTITWPTEVVWPAGSAPTFTSGVDRVTVQKIATSTIQAAIAGQAYA